MEVATTSNHNQSHLHHMAHRSMPHEQHHYEQQQQLQQHSLSSGQHVSTDVSGARSPFQREVREWQRIDPDTGALLSGRLEADRWINGPLHSYGKISDSQNISQPNGTQHTKRKQLEVLQARTAGGAMQVIRAQTVQKTSSRWSSTSASASASASASSTSTSSPVMMTNGGSFRGLLHDHNNHFRSAAPAPQIAETSTRWLQMPSTVDICEVSDGDDDDDDDADYVAEVDSDADGDVHVDDGADVLNERQHSYLINSGRHKINNSNNINGNNKSSRHHSNGSKSFSHKRSNRCGNSSRSIDTSSARRSCRSSNCEAPLLLLDTAPSLKLSNLMKSNSSLSSNNSSNNSISTTTTATTTAPATMNTYKSAGKISLHSIVGNNNNHNTSDTKSPTSTAMSSPTLSSLRQQQQQQRQQSQQRSNSSRHYEQPTLYGNGNNLTKSRVGVAVDCDEAVVAGDAAGSFADDVQRHRQHQHSQQPHAELTPTQLRRQPRRDLESFRHYGTAESEAAADTTTTTTTTTTTAAAATIGAFGGSDGDDDDLRLNPRHQRQQQNFFGVSANQLTRSRSISTDDLSTEWDTHGDHTESPSEWRRVSKLRRSFQNSSSNCSESQYSTPPTTRRPLDLPTSSVSVSKIRAELENGRRLHTAMRNNHVDLAALDIILNAPKDSHASGTQRSSFLTAESLKAIRGRLKKLSDESLYKDDFIAYQQPPTAEELIEVQHVRHKSPTDTRPRLLTPEQSPEISSPKSAFQSVAVRAKPLTTNSTGYLTQRAPATPERQSTHTTNSLESRQKYKDTSSSEWHLRRKSYGFEKMSPPDSKSMFRMDASTDSGLGRSGELANWSPTADQAAPSARGTVIHFGERSNVAAQRYHSLNSPSDNDGGADELLKRHSIAVDESQYVRKTSQVRLNGFYDASEARGKATANGDMTTTTTALFQRSQQKRVEFCKTEVHFAAESGRVNIVETDGKPPPTNNFRRRRRTSSGPLQSLVKSAGPVGDAESNASGAVAVPLTHFGDIQRNKTVTASTVVAYKAGLVEESNDDDGESVEPSNVTVSLPKVRETFVESARSSYASTTSGIDTTTDNEADEIAAIRGILKNKPIKPKPYHLGENIDSTDALWGVQLKPVGGAGSARRDGEVSPTSAATNKSVADRVRIVEKRQDHASISQSNGYSTKINLSLDDTSADWPESGTQNLSARRPSAQELLLQDLREHQRILDEGLKSTSLIIKTMRSANEFDEAMRRLSIVSLEAAVIPPIVVPTPMLLSNSYQESTARRLSNTQSLAEIDGNCLSRRFTTDTHSSFGQPTAAPRFKLIGNADIPVSQQLSQLRRMYEVATSQDDDSADEEVKRYFAPYNENSDSGGGTQDSSSLEDERCIEYSSSWSRLKAKRTIWQIETDERKCNRVLERTELPTSNVMSIELHSPQALGERRDSMKRGQTPPVAKPRTIANTIKSSDHPAIHTATTAKQPHAHQLDERTKESLKIVKEARGARKLREHELSYFGVQISKNDANDTKTKLLPSRRSLPQRKLIDNQPMTTTTPTSTTTTTTTINKTPMLKASRNETKAQTITKWQLLNDKPDLLRHSPIAVEPQLITRVAEIKPKESRSQQQTPLRHNQFDDEEDDEDALDIDSQDEEHLYENITNEIKPVFKVKSPDSYDRKRDLERDARILSEMTKNADQTLKALSDEAAFKDQRRRSLQRRNAKPLETIDEKSIAEKINDSCIAVKVTRGTFASEAKRSSRHSTPSPTAQPLQSRTRTSSLSSVESCPRARSSSLSSEREYENVKVKPVRSKSKPARLSSGQRSSSRESHGTAHVTYSSGDEVCKAHGEQRLRSKHAKRSTAAGAPHKHSAATTRDKHHQQQRTHRDQHRIVDQAAVKDGEKQRAAQSSTTHSSQREERAECHRSSSGRRRRDEHELSKSTRVADDKHKKHEHASSQLSGTGARLLRSLRGRDDEASAHRSSAHRSSTHRSDRVDKEREREKEKEKLSKSKGHSSRSTTTHNSERHAPPRHHNSSPSKLREHKKSTASHNESKPHEHTTHSKNGHSANGQLENGKQHHQQQKPQQKQHHQHAPQEVTISKVRKERK